jgi:Ca-activated chloride channel family protein
MSDAMMTSTGTDTSPMGLLTATGLVPLLGVEIDATLDGPCLQVSVRQRYRNAERVPIEAVYVFPLPEDAAVCGFRAQFGAERVDGRVQARDKAFETYDDAMLDGRMAALLDQERPNVFTASLGNLPAGEEAVLELRYVARLRSEGDAYRLTFPTTVSPRYVPAQAPEVGQPDAERVNPERWLAVPYGLRFMLRVGAWGQGGLRSVESPSHPVRIVLGDDGAEVTLAQDSVALDRDLVVLVQPKAAAAPSALAVPSPDGGETVLLEFLPDMPRAERAPHEVVFLLDCSGSMSGESITAAKRALQLCVRALNIGDTFDIVRFGSEYESLWPMPVAFADGTLAQASAWLDATEAELGGTEILAPLQFILQRPCTLGCARSVVLLTDGEVSNEAEVIALAARHANTTAVFAFGIGSGASDHLVRGVARAGRGEAEMIFPGERIEPKVLRTFARLRSPRFTGVRLDTGDAGAQLAPRELPPLFADSSFSVLARYPSRAPATLVLAAGEHRWAVPVQRSTAAPDAGDGIAPIALCWARERIRDLEAPAATGSRQERASRDVGRRDELVALGEAYGLLSKATSYVAVSSRVVAAGQDAELRRVPVALTAGWGGSGGRSVSRSGGSMRMASMSVSPSRVLGSPSFSADASRELSEFASYDMPAPARLSRSRRAGGASPPPSHSESDAMHVEERGGLRDYLDIPAFLRREADDGPVRQSVADRRRAWLMVLLMTQTASGSFPFSDALQADLGVLAHRLAGREDDGHVVTILVVHLLERRYAEFADETRLAMEKARASMSAEEAADAARRIADILAAL